MALPLLAAIAAIAPVFAAPDSTLVLSTAREHGPVRIAKLTCGPDGGTHRRAEEACTALSAVNGNLQDQGGATAVCTLQYDPVTVTLNGYWRGENRRFTATYSNPCVMAAETGPVFDF